MTSQATDIKQIESMNELDLVRLQEVAKASMDEMRNEVDELDERHVYRIYKHFFERDELEKWVKSENFFDAELYVAVEDDKVIGTLRYKVGEEDEAELQALYVDPDYTKQGLATDLIERAHKDLGDVKKVRADVFEGNEPSLQLLKGAKSFEYYRDGVDEDVFNGVDAIIMRYDLE